MTATLVLVLAVIGMAIALLDEFHTDGRSVPSWGVVFVAIALIVLVKF